MIRALVNIRSLAVCPASGDQNEIGSIEHAALVWDDQGDRIIWVGPERAWTGEADRVDAGGCLVVPGLIDCHTHLAFDGWRADEFTRRCRGESYQEIARAGGGIRRTVAATRAASSDDLLATAHARLDDMLDLGVTTVECKSGYGLTLADELRLLEVYRRLGANHACRVVPTFLGAHVKPKDDPDYVRTVVERMIPEVVGLGLASFCDVFVEEGAFTIEEARRILQAGLAHGLRPKLHADQLHQGGGAELAAEVGAVSADHLEYVSDAGIQALKAAGVVAVALPLASLYLGLPPLNARPLIEAGVPVAVATDFNPGSAPSYHLPLALTLACALCRLTPAEALKGATIQAARAIAREAEVGSLEPGKRADFVVIDAPSVEHWLYHFQANATRAVCVRGVYQERALTGRIES